MSESFESNKSGIHVIPNVPVRSIVLMAIALVIAFIEMVIFSRYNNLRTFLYFIAEILMLAGMCLHKKNLQFLTGIGALLYAASSLYEGCEALFSFYYSPLMAIGTLLVALWAVAAFIVSGLHYVLRKPRPGKTGKMVLMIPLICMSGIGLAANLFSGFYYSNNLYFMSCMTLLPAVFTGFALIHYTPYRAA